jgi:hypothetical protein
MVNRCNDMHIRVLRAALADEQLNTTAWTAGSFRGARVAIGTLARWGCLDAGKVTERGQQLLAAWDTKFGKGPTAELPERGRT